MRKLLTWYLTAVSSGYEPVSVHPCSHWGEGTGTDIKKILVPYSLLIVESQSPKCEVVLRFTYVIVVRKVPPFSILYLLGVLTISPITGRWFYLVGYLYVVLYVILRRRSRFILKRCEHVHLFLFCTRATAKFQTHHGRPRHNSDLTISKVRPPLDAPWSIT